jgi:hypothetical protein
VSQSAVRPDKDVGYVQYVSNVDKPPSLYLTNEKAAGACAKFNTFTPMLQNVSIDPGELPVSRLRDQTTILLNASSLSTDSNASWWHVPEDRAQASVQLSAGCPRIQYIGQIEGAALGTTLGRLDGCPEGCPVG